VREIIANLADLNLISIVSQKPSWAERWQSLSDSLPDVPQISEQEIPDEISAVRQARAAR